MSIYIYLSLHIHKFIYLLINLKSNNSMLYVIWKPIIYPKNKKQKFHMEFQKLTSITQYSLMSLCKSICNYLWMHFPLFTMLIISYIFIINELIFYVYKAKYRIKKTLLIWLMISQKKQNWNRPLEINIQRETLRLNDSHFYEVTFSPLS